MWPRGLRHDVRGGGPLQRAASDQFHREHPGKATRGRRRGDPAGDCPRRGRTRGVNVFMRGQVPAFEETLSGLRTGLLLSVVVIFLLLAANFQSFRLAMAVISPVPAVICGVLLILAGHRDDVERAVVHGRDHGDRDLRRERHPAGHLCRGRPPRRCVRRTRRVSKERAGRLRAILMTAFAMIAGMIPLALGTGERGQTAPLGRAVIGGLFFATMATLVVLPAVYTLVAAARPDTVSHSGS